MKKIKQCECKIGNPIVANGDIYCIQCGGEISDKKAQNFLDKKGNMLIKNINL
jgi:hypothetical protein